MTEPPTTEPPREDEVRLVAQRVADALIVSFGDGALATAEKIYRDFEKGKDVEKSNFWLLVTRFVAEARREC